MSLYPWQEKALTPLNDYAMWCAETGTGKTHAAKLWLKQGNRAENAVVICPKQLRASWKADAPYATVYSFEDFKKYDPPKNPKAIVVDEADAMASPLFVAKLRSQRTEKLYKYTQAYPQCHVLLLTATPVRSSPWNMHTLLVLNHQVSPDSWKRFRDAYFELTYKPFLPRPAWFPKKTWRKDMQKLINKYAHVALMGDMVDLPEETHEVIKLKKPDYEENAEWEPMAQFVADHRLEQLPKGTTIKELSRGYRKAVIVAHFTESIDSLQKELSKERQVFVLDGRTKNPERVIADAEADDECFFIIQASIGAGFELPSFSVMIFASMGFSVRNYIQMKGRIKRINALKPLKYFYLIGGDRDQAVYDNIKAGKDFVPSEYLKHVRTTKEN
jgi:superfamily II DNA or RNA helicase